MHRVGCCVMWEVWRESLWCGCGCDGTVRGLGLCVVWRLDHGAWATIDVLAALQYGTRSEQPKSQLESQELCPAPWVAVPSQAHASSHSQEVLVPTNGCQPLSQPQEPSQPQLVLYVPLRTRRERRARLRKKGGSTQARRTGRPAVVATHRRDPTNNSPHELPPIACAVDSARDRGVVRREGRVVRLVVRWEHPAVDCGEHHREVDEHRILWSSHRPVLNAS